MRLDLQVQSQLYVGLFERELHPWITRLSQGVRCVVDIGAGDGEYSLFGLAKTNADRVLAFEPSFEMCRRLRENVNHSPRPERLQIYQTAIGSTDTPTQTSVATLAQRVLVPCLLKMDIDGGEANVLRLASEHLLAINGLRWIVETHSKSLEDACAAIFTQAGYSVQTIPNAWWRRVIPEQRVSPHNRWLVALNESTELFF
jgi:predicted RNA methylase